MLAFVLAACAFASDTPSLAELHAAALGDLVTAVPATIHRDTRYLSLHAYAPGPGRDSLYKSLVFALNSTSFRSRLYAPPRVYKGTLVRLSLSGLGWDVGSRQARIALIRGQGVDTATFRDDLWEEIIRGEPYFLAGQNYQDRYIRGWVDPEVDRQLRIATHSTKAVIRADWLIQRLLRETKQGDVYSQALLLPPAEGDLYKAFGVDEKFLLGPSLRNGGAVSDSGVALHARELQFIPSLFGWDEKYITRTFDFATDEVGDKSPFDRLVGTVKHDGREIIGSLPNGLTWGYLSDGKGVQTNVVPQAIALDQRSGPFLRVKDRSVVNFYKCVSCHGEVGAIQPFSDEICKAILSPKIGLAVIARSKEGLYQTQASVEDYYIADLPAKINRMNGSYAARVKECNGLTSAVNSQAINDAVEGYVFGLVTPEQAAREQGHELKVANVLWRTSGNSYGALLSSGQPVRRAAFEAAFPDILKADVYRWENPHAGK